MYYMKKAYSYIRFSSPEQAKGRSKSRQLESCELFCAANNLELATGKEYSFFDKAKSAFSSEHIGPNGQLARFLRMVENGSIPKGSYLIVESLDRLGRDRVKYALPRFIDLLNQDINIVTLSDGKTYTSDYTEIDLILSILIMTRAHEESSIKALRVGDAWRKKKDDARTGNKAIGNNAPLWLTHNDGVYVINEPRADVVRRIFQMSIDGYGKIAIAKALNAESIASFKGGTWATSSLQKLLTNKAVIGEYQPHTGKWPTRIPVGDPIPGYYPAIVDRSTFNQALEATHGRRVGGATNPTEHYNLWQGISKCALCQGSMHKINKGRPPRGNNYLHCINARKGICAAKHVRLDQSEIVFKEILAKVDSLSLVQDSSAAIEKLILASKGQLFEQETKLAECKASLSRRITSIVEDLAYECEQQIKALKKEIAALDIELASESIVDKQHFFSKLDLESYEGRYRANGLLKRLKILIFIDAEIGRVSYVAVQDSQPVLGLNDENGTITATPFTIDQLGRVKDQDFPDTLGNSYWLLLMERALTKMDDEVYASRLKDILDLQ